MQFRLGTSQLSMRAYTLNGPSRPQRRPLPPLTKGPGTSVISEVVGHLDWNDLAPL